MSVYTSISSLPPHTQYGLFIFTAHTCREVSDILTNLKGIATDMGTELDRQNAQIDRLERKSDANHVHMMEANRRVHVQLH